MVLSLCVGFIILAVLWPVVRALVVMIFFASVVWACLNSSSNSATLQNTNAMQIMSYDDLVKYPVSCEKKDSQLAELTKIQKAINFNPDPDLLSESDRTYNSRLKATIWWYAYRCE
jgi:hypothetical protein